MAGQKGITLVSLIITIVLLLIITGTTVYTSVNRFKINNLQKMYNDIELLDDKIDNYYVKYGGLPVLKNENNEPIKYTYSNINEETNKKYTEVEYIESTGTQYIETDIYPTNKTSVTLTMMIMSGNVVSGWSSIVGPYNSQLTEDYFSVHYNSTQDRFGMRWFGQEYSGSGINVGIMPKDRKFTMKFGQEIYNVDSTSDIYYSFADISDTISPYKLSLFEQGNTTVKNGIFRIYEAVIKNDDKVYDLIPAIDKDNVACLYDKVNDKFYYNSGTGNFKTNLDEEESITEEDIDTNFIKDVNDNENYYIIDLSAIGDITLNYGKEGYENPNSSDDVYIINEKSHTVYYVRGIEYTDGKLYHSKKVNENINEDTIPPTEPEIKVVDGDKISENHYETNVTIEFVPGKDNYSGVNKTKYSINGNTEQDIDILENYQYKINETGIYEVTLKTYDNNNNVSEITKTIYIGQIKQVEYLESTGTQYIDTGLKVKEGINIEIKTRVNEKKASDGVTFFGAVDSNGKGFCSTIGWSWSNYAFSYGDGYSGITNIPIVINEDILIKNNGISIFINEEECTQSITGNMGTFANNSYQNYNILLLNRIKNGSVDNKGLSGRFYYCKIWDNDTLVRDYIPVIDQNGVACLYDKVEGKFYYNAGTGEFKTNLDE